MDKKIMTAKEFLAELEKGRNDFTGISVREPVYPWEIEKRLMGKTLVTDEVTLKPGFINFSIKGNISVMGPSRVSILALISGPIIILLVLLLVATL